jgi:hypothetical protein
VDVERGRTVPNWRPRRLGGGLGSTRVGGDEVNQKYSGRCVSLNLLLNFMRNRFYQLYIFQAHVVVIGDSSMC